MIGGNGTYLRRELSAASGGELVGVEFGPETLSGRRSENLPGFFHGVRRILDKHVAEGGQTARARFVGSAAESRSSRYSARRSRNSGGTT